MNIDSVRIHADDSGGAGGVQLPSVAAFTWAGGSASLSIVDPDPGSTAPSWLEFANLGITAVSSLTVQLRYTDQWIFVDEVKFMGTVVPEPSTYALMGLGLVGLLVSARRRNA